MKLPIEDAIMTADTWTKTMHLFGASIPHENGERTEVSYSRNELTAFDPRLPVVFDLLWQRKAPNYPNISSERIRQTYMFWTQGALEIPSIIGPINYALDISTFQYEANSLFAKMMINTYILSQAVPDILYVIDTMWVPAKVPLAWIDEKYPGWQKRWEVAQALDYATPRAQAAYVLANISSENVVMTEVSF